MKGKPSTFGAMLRERRTAKGYSLRKMARLIGVSPTYLSQIEQGKVETPPTTERVRRMAEVLGANPDELITLAGRVPDDLPRIIQSQPETIPELLRTMSAMTAEQAQKLLDYARRIREENR